MNMAFRLAAPLLALMAPTMTAAHAHADEVVPYDLALSRLKACVTSGAAGAPRDSLQSALVAIRSLCQPQINRVYEAADRRIDEQNPAADADRLVELRKQAHRQIDFELAALISQTTGLQP